MLDPDVRGLFLSGSEWLKEYYSRIIEEYRFSMERKDRVTDWAIGILFVALVAYAELLREQSPSIWRIYLTIGLLCFIVRLFFNSCLAYAYLKKWRYLLDLIEKYWRQDSVTLEFVEKEIEGYHHTPRTTETRTYFIKSQLKAGFLLLFLSPFFLLSFEIFFKLQGLNELVIPLLILIAYYTYETVMFIEHKALNMPEDDGKKRLRRALFHPTRLAILFLIAFFLIFSLYVNYLNTLDYSRTKDLIGLIVTTDASIIAFTGVIASMILKHVFEEEKEKEKTSDISVTSGERNMMLIVDYKKKRHEVIKFVAYTLTMLIGSILSGLVAIMIQSPIVTQAFITSMLLSFSFLFTGIIELLATLIYSLETEFA